MPTDLSRPEPDVLLIVALGQTSGADITERQRFIESALHDRRRVAIVFDASRSGERSATQRLEWARWIERHHRTISRFVAGCAFVVPNPLVRGIVTAVSWLRPLPCPHTLVEVRQEAMLCARRWLGRTSGPDGLRG